jgi:siroheme synthase-like protein
VTDTAKMFPLVLNVTALPVMLVGGSGLVSRIAALEEHGATALHIYAAEPGDDLVAAAGTRLQKRWPEAGDFRDIRPKLVFISDLDDTVAVALRAEAHAVGALVHVQDRVPLCDIHMPARIRRGHLQVTVSTDGTAAGLARHIREYLENDVFGPEWAARVDEIAAKRRQWKAQGFSIAELARAVADFVSRSGWLKRP